MKNVFAVLAFMLCLLPAAVLAEIKVNGVAASMDANGVITINQDGAIITGSAENVCLVAQANVSSLTFENVHVTAPAGEHTALELKGSDVTLTFIGQDNVFTGGKNASTVLGTSGGDGIVAEEKLTIRGTVTARGGEGMDGGDGIKAKVLILEGAVSAEGGYGGGEEGGEGIESDDELFVAPSAVVKVVGGAGVKESGHGVDSVLVKITDGAMLYVEAGGDDKPAIYGSFSGAGYESNDGVNWTYTTQSTMRYFTSRPPAQLPKTGDPSMLMAWTALLGVSAMGLKLRRKR